MQIHEPFIISSQLLPGLLIAGATFQLEYSGVTRDGRTVYRYTIDLPDGQNFIGTDLKSDCGGGNLQSGFESLVDFLAACGGGYAYRQRTGRTSENENLFPSPLAKWAYENLDELSMMRDLLTHAEQEHKVLIEE